MKRGDRKGFVHARVNAHVEARVWAMDEQSALYTPKTPMILEAASKRGVEVIPLTCVDEDLQSYTGSVVLK